METRKKTFSIAQVMAMFLCVAATIAVVMVMVVRMQTRLEQHLRRLENQIALQTATATIIGVAQTQEGRNDLRLRWCQGNVRRATAGGWVSCKYETIQATGSASANQYTVHVFAEPESGESLGKSVVMLDPSGVLFVELHPIS